MFVYYAKSGMYGSWEEHLCSFEFVPVRLGLGQLSLARVAVVAEDRQKHVGVGAATHHVTSDHIHDVFLRYKHQLPAVNLVDTIYNIRGSVAEWLACWTQAQKGPGSIRSRDAVG